MRAYSDSRWFRSKLNAHLMHAKTNTHLCSLQWIHVNKYYLNHISLTVTDFICMISRDGGLNVGVLVENAVDQATCIETGDVVAKCVGAVRVRGDPVPKADRFTQTR